MIRVVHGQEPRGLQDAKHALRVTPDVPYHYDHLSSDGKAAAREQLLLEQGHLCAYCMRRIGTESHKAHIEHWLPRSKGTGEMSLDYGNMLAVCDGGGGRPIVQTCDVRKGDHSMALDPRNEHHVATLSYGFDGRIHSSDDVFQEEIDEVLNLNAKGTLLPMNRKAALEKAREELDGIYRRHARNTKAAHDEIQRKVTKLEEHAEYRDEFVGVVIWRFKDHLKRHASS